MVKSKSLRKNNMKTIRRKMRGGGPTYDEAKVIAEKEYKKNGGKDGTGIEHDDYVEARINDLMNGIGSGVTHGSTAPTFTAGKNRKTSKKRKTAKKQKKRK